MKNLHKLIPIYKIIGSCELCIIFKAFQTGFEAAVRYLEKLLKAMWIFFLLKDSTGRRVLDISQKR